MPAGDGCKNLIEDLILKFYFYMGHAVQVTNQNNAIKNVMSKMNDDSYFCVVIMDFNIKFETMKQRNNAVENFGKRCLS